ncbi:MAG: ribosome maturation factor RimP [Tissierellaceae bacterium]
MGKRLSRQEIIKIVREISDVVADELGYELVDVEYVKEHGDYYLRIYIYRDEGIGLDDCQKMSQIISERLDDKDPIPDAYYLEVSSPGLDRPLKTDRDLERNLNKNIEIKLYKAIDNKKLYEGELQGYNEKEIRILDYNDKEIVIPREAISLVRLAIKF